MDLTVGQAGHKKASTDIRVSSNLENLEMLGNFNARRKSQGKVRIFKNQEKSGKSQGILLCEIHFQPI